MIFDGLIPIPHTSLRIASGKITNYVEFALEHFKDLGKPALLLHTFPLEISPPLAGPSTSTPAIATIPIVSPAPTSSAHDPKRKPSPCPTSQDLPKLISIVEIIKRTYTTPISDIDETGDSIGITASVKTKRSRKGKGKLVDGLHQYTRLGCLEEFNQPSKVGPDGLASEKAEVLAQRESERQEEVVLNWIETGGGTSKRPRRHHSPYLLIVLSACALVEFDKNSKWTHQLPERKSVTKAIPDAKRTTAVAAVSTISDEPSTMELDSVVQLEEQGPEKKKRKRRKQRSKGREESKKKVDVTE